MRTYAAFQGSSLAQAYVRSDPDVTSFYPRHYAEGEAYREKLEELRRRFSREDRARAVGFLRSSPDSGSRAERLQELVDEGGGFVVAGQQPGLFGGPLYTLYKAVTAVTLARGLEERLEAPILPLFWVASEDHDWDEVREARLLDPDNELRAVSLAPPTGVDGGPAPPFHRPAPGASLEGALEAFLEALPDTEFAPPLMELLTSAYDPDRPLNESFARLLEGFPGLEDLWVVDAAEPGLKEATLPTLLAELEEAAGSEERLRERTTELEGRGHEGQVPILPKGVNLFLEGPRGRERLFRDPEGGGFRLRHSGTRLTEQEVRGRASDDPRVLSPNVLLRPVAESSALPVLASVTGPGEIAYFAQLAPLFQRHGIEMPVVHPRLSAFLVEGKVAKVLDKFRLTVADLARPRHEVEGRVVREELSDDVESALQGIRRGLGEGSSELEEAVRDIDPTLRGSVDRARRQAFSAFEEAEKKVLQGLKRRNEVALAQLAKAQGNLYPDGRPQERVLSPFYFLFRYGPDLVARVREEAEASTLGKPESPTG